MSGDENTSDDGAVGNDESQSPLFTLETKTSDLEDLNLPATFSNDECNEEELRNLAESLAPRVTSLLSSNEAELEHMLLSQEREWLDEEEKFHSPGRRKRIVISLSDDDISEDSGEDGMGQELNGLSNAEQLLREELEMSNLGFHFDGVTYEEEYDDDEEQVEIGSNDDDLSMSSESKDRDKPGTESPKKDQVIKSLLDETTDSFEDSDDSDNAATNNSLEIQNDVQRNAASGLKLEEEPSPKTSNLTPKNQLTIPTGMMRPNQQAYTLYDHAKYLSLEFDNADLGSPTCPLLTRESAEIVLDTPSFRPTLMNGNEIPNNGRPKFTKSMSSLSNEDEEGLAGNVKMMSVPVKGAKGNVSSREESKSREENIREILECAREYIRPMPRSMLGRIYEGLADVKPNKKRRKKRSSSKPREDNAEAPDGQSKAKEEVEVEQEVLPVRTVSIRIRPDVLCGAVMDAVYTAVQSLNGEVTKRQGGHLRALVRGYWMQENEGVSFRPDENQTETAMGVMNMFSPTVMSPSPAHRRRKSIMFGPPTVLDAQLCTRKRSKYGERILLMRFYRIDQGESVDDGQATCPPNPLLELAGFDDPNHSLSSTPTNALDQEQEGLIIREAAALFQRMRFVATTGGSISFEIDGTSPVFPSNLSKDDRFHSPSRKKKKDKSSGGYAQQIGSVLVSPLKLFSPSKSKKTGKKTKSMSVRFNHGNKPVLLGAKAAQEIASEKLIRTFSATPSIRDPQSEIVRLPALSEDDWPTVQSSWKFISECLNELDHRDLAFSTLTSCPFGAFPALPTLDVHYCSQMKSLSKENMIVSLLKEARELEQFARESEYSCAQLIKCLHSTFQTYKLDPPPLPTAVALSAYPLDFQSPEESCPPWGQKVVEALNRVTADSTTANAGFIAEQEKIESSGKFESKSEFQKARKAVAAVLAAFQKQEDEELSARLGRKNVQVMDRLAKMQAHKRESIVTIRDAYGSNTIATQAADHFHKKVDEGIADNDKSIWSADETSEATSPFNASDQVPLLTTRIFRGRSPGTCFITSHQMLFLTHHFLGDNEIHTINISDVFVKVNPASKSMLNPLPTSISVYSDPKGAKGEALITFRPSIGASMFKDFFDIVKAVEKESASALQFSSRGGLLYMFDEKTSVAKAALKTSE